MNANNTILLPLLVLLPFAGGVLCWLFGYLGDRKERAGLQRTRSLISILVTIAEWVMVMLLLSVRHNGVNYVFPSLFGLGIGLELDGLRWILCFIAVTVWLAVSVYGIDYMKQSMKRTRYELYFLICEGATLGVFLAPDMYTMLVFFEMMSMSSWVLVAHNETEKSHYAADSYLAYAVIGGLVTLMGLFLLYHMFGTVRIAELKMLAASYPNRKLLYVAGALTAVGFCIKSGMWPLHTWLPSSYTMAPTTITTLLSSVLSKTGVFGLTVILTQIFANDRNVGYVALALALITMVIGAVLGIFSTDIKRTLACSSISQIGFVLTGLATTLILQEEGIYGAYGMVLHLLNHSLFKLVLFLAVGAIILKLGVSNYNDVRGFGRNKPLLIFAILMGLIGLAGIPGGSGYISKTLLHESIVEAIEVVILNGQSPLWLHITEWVFLISGGCTFAYMTTLFVCVCVEKNSDAKVQETYDQYGKSWCGSASKIVIGLFALVIPVLGCIPRIMEILASFSNLFMGLELWHPVHYFSLEILKGAGISILVGLVVYFLFVRRKLLIAGTYTDRWPQSLDLEKSVYRPMLLNVLPFVGTLLAKSIATLPELIRIGFCKLLYSNNNNGVVIPGMDDTFTVYVAPEKDKSQFGETLGTSLLFISMGLVIILIYLLLQ